MARHFTKHDFLSLEHSSQFSSSLLYGNCINHRDYPQAKKTEAYFCHWIIWNSQTGSEHLLLPIATQNINTFHLGSQGQSVFLFFAGSNTLWNLVAQCRIFLLSLCILLQCLKSNYLSQTL